MKVRLSSVRLIYSSVSASSGEVEAEGHAGPGILSTPDRFWLRVAFAGSLIVLLLSTVGIYSIVSFTVARRTREIGIRAALGATPRRIVRTVLARALAQLGLGVAVGAALMVVLMVSDGGELPSARMVAIITLGAAIVVAVGVAACIVPARRALRIQPTVALKTDA